MIKLTDFYIVNIESICQEINHREVSKVLIQLPEGIKRFSWEVIELIRSKCKLKDEVTIDIDGSPNYGSCMISHDVIKDYDLVVHIGHDPYPYTPRFSNVIYLELLSKITLTEELMNELVMKLKECKARRITLLTTQQHKNLIKDVRKKLSNYFEVITPLNPVITGCLIPKEGKELPKNIDAYVVIAGGSFHSLGVGLSINALKPVIRVDPYSSIINNVNGEVKRLLRIREWKIYEARSSRKWLIISGISGQYRRNIINKLIEVLKTKGIRYWHAKAPYLTINELRNIDSENYDVIVITSCPRLAIDDLSKYHKPVLTPGEAFKALGIVDEYVYPW